jgi:hypothetical protein
MYYHVGVEFFVKLRMLLTLEEVYGDLFGLNTLKVKGDASAPSSRAFREAIELIHIKDIMQQISITDISITGLPVIFCYYLVSDLYCKSDS